MRRERQGFLRPRQGFQHDVVPEEQLQQQRHIAHGLDIEGAEPADHEIARQPGGPDREAEQARQRDPDCRDEQRVEQTDEEGPAIGRGGRIGDEMLIDIETCRLIPEREINRNVMRPHIGEAGRGGGVDQKREEAEKEDLDCEAAQGRVAHERWRCQHRPALSCRARRGRTAPAGDVSGPVEHIECRRATRARSCRV